MNRTCVVSLLLAAAASAQEPRKEMVPIPGTPVAFEMVLVPGGKAKLGSPAGEAGRGADESPVREVDLRPFWISTREVSWAEYTLYYESRKEAKVDGVTRPSQPDVIDPKEPFENGAEQGPDHPAISIGWFGAMGYCEWLSKKTGQRFRLPTEAEWEHAARAGAPGAAFEPLADHAWFDANSDAHSHERAKKKPNAWGLFDTLGNAWEHTLEPYQPPALGPALRGGGWKSPAADVRFANRQNLPDEWAERDPKRPLRLWWVSDGNFIGLRIVRPADPAPKEAQEAARAKLEVRNLKWHHRGKRPEYMAKVTGELHYEGDAPLDEVEVTVFYLDEDGKPMLKDPKDKPAYNTVYPALVNSFHEGPHRKPLRKGETRAFELEVPHPFIEAGPLDLNQVGAKVTGVHLSKP
jgi:formylglycine-generating enzyme required for sulfatase activity